jgi:phenylpropionate dioxygenase-like ring-hydroxylating dioxygenase large terminal subunit
MSSVQDGDALWQARFVNREVYTSEEILRLEKERIFARSWHFACFVHDLKAPGDFFTLSVADQPVLLLRGNDGEIRAFYNACTHRGAVLTGERCGNYGRVLKCMYHAWAFNLKGELVGVPYEQGYGPNFNRGEYGLVPVHCETFHDLVFVALKPAVPALLEYLGEMAEHLAPYATGVEPIGRNSWIYHGNWKLWHENFRDNYHPEFAHRNVHDSVPHYADRGGNWALSPGHSVLQWISEAPNIKTYLRGLSRYGRVAFPEDSLPSLAASYEYVEAPQEVLAVFPNMDIQPGPKHEGTKGRRGLRTGFIQTVTPLAVDRSRVDLVVYSSTEDDEEARKSALESLADNQGSWGKISVDDTEAAYRCQQGVRGQGTTFSPFTRGVEPGKGGQHADARDEYSQREFYRVYKEYLERKSEVRNDVALSPCKEVR